jgi:hypothetical protein
MFKFFRNLINKKQKKHEQIIVEESIKPHSFGGMIGSVKTSLIFNEGDKSKHGFLELKWSDAKIPLQYRDTIQITKPFSTIYDKNKTFPQLGHVELQSKKELDDKLRTLYYGR